MISRIFTIVLFLLVAVAANSQTTQTDSIVPFEEAYKRTYNIKKVTDGVRPVIDGKLDDDFWKNHEWSEQFVQIIPYERVVPDSKTRVKLAYDDKNIYVGVWCHDSNPDKINKFIGNRDDNTLGDLISVALDTYHDYRAASEFNINVGGNKTDLIVTDKLSINRSWNAIWEGKTYVNIKDSVWFAELAIPFSQLRYNKDKNDGSWGLHVRRIRRSNNEVQNWSMIPLKNNGHVYSFGNMEGMEDVPKPRDIEFTPYVMTKYTNQTPIAGSPYSKRSNWNANGGLDAKMAFNDYTVDVTINPDYGQVELDPSVMNLTAYETFYEEKRPFFLEGKHILDFASGDDMMFYTRRIGATSRYTPSYDNINSFATENSYIPIIGAAKLTGTSKNGLTVGVIESLTARTFAQYTDSNGESDIMTEPLTNYTVARLQKNWKGNTLLGGMLTSVNRFGMEDQISDIAVKDAITAGLDFTHYFKKRMYYIDSKMMFSSLSGSKEAINYLQTSSVHYFQRESSSNYLSVDENATSMTGTGGYLKLGRKGDAKWTFAQTAGWLSPSLNLNDVGYLRETDNFSTESEVNYRQTDTWRNFRANVITLTQGNKWTFGGTPIENYARAYWQMMTLNLYELKVQETYYWNELDTRMLRGGSDMRISPSFDTYIFANTDRSNRVIASFTYNGSHHLDGYNRYNEIIPSVNCRIGDRFYIKGEIDLLWNRDNMQYVTTVTPTTSGSSSSKEYIMGHLDQKTYGLTLTAQLNVTPDLSFQYYGSPFTSIGKFTNFKEAANTTSCNYNARFDLISDDKISLSDGTYSVTKDGKSYQFSNPDFNFNEFRSNLVVRWEYLPGSTMYLVWENRISENTSTVVNGWGDNINQMFTLPSTNTVMLKVSYWFGL